MLDTIIKSLGQKLPNEADKAGYTAQGPFAAKHGSWSITFHKSSRNLDRFAILSLTPSLPSLEPASGQYDVEIWVGAHVRSHYTRKLAWSYSIEAGQFSPETSSNDSLEVLQKGLSKALMEADGISVADLTQTDLGAVADKNVA